MDTMVRVQGRQLGLEDIGRIQELIAAHPDWSRRRVSEELCAEWNWRNGAGRLKDMATRSLLVKLDARGLIELPARRQVASNRMRSQRIRPCAWDTTPLTRTLPELGPLTIREVSTNPAVRDQCAAALAQFHYLGYSGSVGENLQYAVTDPTERLVACVLFGSSAWKCRARDQFIGWTPEQRTHGLHLLTNNRRFLILPWVRVPHLASWVLGRVLRRVSAEWQDKYGHPIALVETFVDRSRFVGTSYQASNWMHLGSTTGRSRQDRQRTLCVGAKDVYLYPLHRAFRTVLCR
jgi:hypothetical protein